MKPKSKNLYDVKMKSGTNIVLYDTDYKGKVDFVSCPCREDLWNEGYSHHCVCEHWKPCLRGDKNWNEMHEALIFLILNKETIV